MKVTENTVHRYTRWILWVGLFFIAESLLADVSADPRSLWIVNATVVDMRSSDPAVGGRRPGGRRPGGRRPGGPAAVSLTHRVDVRIEHGRITHVVEARPATPRRGRVVDADGKFLLPGFIDTHAHVALGPVSFKMVDGAPVMKMTPDPEVPRRSLLSLLAHGVTTVRDPGGPSKLLLDLRDQSRSPAFEGPRLRVAGEVIDRSTFEGLTAVVQGPEQVRAEVRRQAAAGVDWIKLYTQLDRDELRAGIEQAHSQGLPAVAHLQQISWTEAAEMGLDAVVHGVPGSELLLPAEKREAYRPDLLGTQFLFSWFEHVDFDSPEIEGMLKAMVRAEMTVDLTLVAFEGMVLGDRPAHTRDLPELRWAAPSLVDSWRSFFTFNVGWVPRDFERARRAWPKALEFARRLHEAGLLLTVGTDANNPWTVAGPSFHRELELLDEAGIDRLEILRMASVNGARVLGLDNQVGTIAPGFQADLVLLERNPLDDISATRDLLWVMRSGRLYPPDLLLRRAAGEKVVR